jgi:N-acetylmuramoyl-L-alanine amidase
MGTYEQIPDGWKKSNGLWFYYKDSNLTLGWIKDKSKWYYLDKITGVMQTGLVIVSGKKYFLNSSGAMVTGWKQIDKKWYFFNKDNGDMLKNEWIEEGNKKYYVGVDGIMVSGLKTIKDRYYFFKSSGTLAIGKVSLTVQTDEDGALAI